MMKTLQEQEGPIDQAIVNSLVESTPDWWKSALLEIEQKNHSQGIVGYTHKISSPEGHRDIVQATEELCLHTFELAELFREHGKQWTKAVFRIEQLPTSDWNYVVDFSYERSA